MCIVVQSVYRDTVYCRQVVLAVNEAHNHSVGLQPSGTRLLCQYRLYSVHVYLVRYDYNLDLVLPPGRSRE